MPKKPVRNSFYFFMLDYKKQEEASGAVFPNGMKDVAEAAGPVWANLDSRDRKKYEQQVADYKQKNTRAQHKYTSFGETLEQVEKRDNEVKNMEEREQKDIRNIVKLKAFNNLLHKQEFCVMDVNIYCQTEQKYVPCEFTMLVFTLEEGIIYTKLFHSFVDPGFIPPGYTSDAKASFQTHNIPLPPLPEDYKFIDYGYILSSIVDILGGYNDLMPIFTMPLKVAPILSFLDQLCGKAEDPSQFKVYKLNNLYYTLLDAIEPGAMPKESLALSQLKKDQFEYSSGLACWKHEDSDVFQNCTMSRAKRWTFTILDHCCPIAGINLIPGYHVPGKLDLEAIADSKEKRKMSQQNHELSAPTSLPPVWEVKTNAWNKPAETGFLRATADAPTSTFDSHQWPAVGRRCSTSTDAGTAFTAPTTAASMLTTPNIRKPKGLGFAYPVAPQLTDDDFPNLAGRGRGSRTKLSNSINNMKIGG